MNAKAMEQALPKILIAEDNELYRSSLARLLGNYKIVGEAVDGQQAIDLVKSTHPDLLILDLSLPKISGIEVARQLRPHFPLLKILVLTMYDSEDHINETVQAGVDGYCLKDKGRDKLLAAVNRILDGQSYITPEIYDLVDPTKSPRITN